MTTPLVANNVYQHTTFINDRTLANGPSQCAVLRRFYQVVSVGAPPATMEDLVASLDGGNAANYKALLNNLAEYRGSSLRRVTGAVPYELAVTTITNVGVGTAGAIAMAKQTAGLVSFQTAFIGKKNRGRQYIPFPSTSDDQGDGVPTASYVTRLGTLVNNLIYNNILLTVGGRTANFSSVIWSRKVPGYTALILTSLQSGRWATQRRRGDYGKKNLSPI